MHEVVDAVELVETGRLSELEDAWVARLAENPEDLDYFVAVAELLSSAGERDRARFLLELVDEELETSNRCESRLELLTRAGLVYLDPLSVHSAAMTSLRRIYCEHPSLEGLIDKVGLLRAVADTAKTWEKVTRLRQLMQFEIDTIVWMEGKGAGRVVEVNLELDSFKLEFEGHSPLRVGFAAAAKLLQVLPESHIDRRKIENPESLEELEKSAPHELLRVVLESYDRPLTGSDIRKSLTGIVSGWSNWWGEARKHPQVIASGSAGRQKYRWVSSEEDALQEVRRRFAEAEVNEKLEIFRKNAVRGGDLVDDMRRQLRDLADSASGDRPGVALTIWYGLDARDADTGRDWSPKSILRSSQDPAALIAALSERSLRERLFGLCREVRPDWIEVYRRAFSQEKDPRLLSHLFEQLGEQDRETADSVVDDLLSHPKRSPAAFVWLAEEAGSESLVGNRNPLRLLRQILDSLHQADFSSFRTRLLRIFQSDGAASRLLTRLTEDQARQAERALQRAPIDQNQRDTLIKFLHLRFPVLDVSKEPSLYATPSSIDKRRRELRRLLEEEIPANRRAIEEARAHGDLRENFEYKAARQRHEYLTLRVEALERDLTRVRPLDSQGNDRSEVRLGSRVELRDRQGRERWLTILGPWESDPDGGVVSYDSDLGRALLGKKTGDSIDIEGRNWQVAGIESCA